MFGGQRRLRVLACTCVAVAALSAACGDGGGETTERASVPTAESTTTTDATTTTAPAPEFEALLADPALTPEQQVEAAYFHSWDIYLDALRTGRTDYLDLVYVDPSLSDRKAQVDQLISDGRRIEGEIDPQIFSMAVLTDTEAVVIGEYRNHLVYVDAESGDPLEPDPDVDVSYRYRIVLEEGSWRIKYVEPLS